MSIPFVSINTPKTPVINPPTRPAEEIVLKKSELPRYDMNRLLAAKEVVLDKPEKAENVLDAKINESITNLEEAITVTNNEETKDSISSSLENLNSFKASITSENKARIAGNNDLMIRLKSVALDTKILNSQIANINQVTKVQESGTDLSNLLDSLQSNTEVTTGLLKEQTQALKEHRDLKNN